MGFFWKKKDVDSQEDRKSLEEGMGKTKRGIFEKLSRAVVGKSKIDDSVLDDIEDALVASDIGVDTTLKIIDMLEEKVAQDKYMNTEELNSILKGIMCSLLDVDGAMKDCDLVITGEGRFDTQSLMGKVVGSLAEKAKAHGLPLYVIPGCAEDGLSLYRSGVTGVFPLTCYPPDALPDRTATAKAVSAQAQRLCELLSNINQI